jgi:nitrite reductase/ring-hydroxylating ferredoxin subunit
MRIQVCPVDALPQGSAIRLAVEPPIAVFHVPSGYFAIDDLCTHGKASLSEGFVEDDTVECPLHMAQFCLRTGKALSAPATQPVGTHAVSVVDGTICVDVNR